MYDKVADAVRAWLLAKVGYLPDVMVSLDLFYTGIPDNYGDDYLLLFDNHTDNDSPATWLDDWWEGQDVAVIRGITILNDLEIPRTLSITVRETD